jgi:hypothetical protein
MTGLKDEPVKLWGKISEARLIGISALEELHIQKNVSTTNRKHR